jgi:hypothetical protein
MTDTTTREDLLVDMRSTTLRQIETASTLLARSLQEVRRDADRALEALATGQGLAGRGHGGGPLGHQTPGDVMKHAARLDTLVDQAVMLGCTTDQITAAYIVAA